MMEEIERNEVVGDDGDNKEEPDVTLKITWKIF